MKTINVSEITKNIKEMCIEANHFLTDDMKCRLDEAVIKKRKQRIKKTKRKTKKKTKKRKKKRLLTNGMVIQRKMFLIDFQNVTIVLIYEHNPNNPPTDCIVNQHRVRHSTIMDVPENCRGVEAKRQGNHVQGYITISL